MTTEQRGGDLAAYPSAENCTKGLTKRELFAAMAMQGALGGTPGGHLHFKQLAVDSVAHADALLAELEKARG